MAKMVSWPPSPSVEDETVALSHEHLSDTTIQSETEDYLSDSRGVIDQYPILIETSEYQKRQESTTPNAHRSDQTEGSSSDDSKGPATPPPGLWKEKMRPTVSMKSRSTSFHKSGTVEQVATATGQAQKRPHLSKIDTQVAEDPRHTTAACQRVPSSHSYAGRKSPGEPLASSPVLLRSPINIKTSPVQQGDNDRHSSSQSENEYRNADRIRRHKEESTSHRRRRSKSMRRSKSRRRNSHSDQEDSRRTRDGYDLSGSDSGRRHRRPSHSSGSHFYQSPRGPTADRFTPPHSRRESRGSFYGSGTEDHHVRQSLRMDAENRGLFESPCVSSADEASRASRSRRVRQPSAERVPSTRRERSRLNDLTDRLQSTRSTYSSQGNFPQRAGNLDGSTYSPLATPLTMDTEGSVENYLERAFRDNERKNVSRQTTNRGYGSAINTPVVSPPRTPRSERYSRDYLGSDVSSYDFAHRAPLASQHSRQPVAAPSPPTTRSSPTAGSNASGRTPIGLAQPFEPRAMKGIDKLANTSSKHNLTAAGEASYPTRPELHPRSQSSRYTPHYQQLNSSARPSHETQRPVTSLPHRASSYAGYGQQSQSDQFRNGLGADFSRGPLRGSSEATPSQTARAGKPLAYQDESKARSTTTKEPGLREWHCPCPRGTSDGRGWCSFKEMSEVDVCPACASALRKTRFSGLIVPSLPKPYDDQFECAMSNPWFHAGVLQSLKRGSQYMYECLPKLIVPPPNSSPCAGNAPAIRRWFHIIDPATQRPVSNFSVCTACVWAIDTIFPEVSEVLERPANSLLTEKVCSLHTNSRSFYALLDHFEQAASHAQSQGQPLRTLDTQPLADRIRRVCRR